SLATFEVGLVGSSSHADTLPGGYYGQFCYGFLITHLERFGAFLMVFFTLLVALLVSTDTLVYPALARAGQVVGDGDRWRTAGSASARVGPSLLARLPRLRVPSLPAFLRRREAAPAPEARKRSARSPAARKPEAAAAPERPEAQRPEDAAPKAEPWIK